MASDAGVCHCIMATVLQDFVGSCVLLDNVQSIYLQTYSLNLIFSLSSNWLNGQEHCWPCPKVPG